MEELTLANEKLVDVNDLKNKFPGIALHDLMNPLVSLPMNNLHQKR